MWGFPGGQRPPQPIPFGFPDDLATAGTDLPDPFTAVLPANSEAAPVPTGPVGGVSLAATTQGSPAGVPTEEPLETMQEETSESKSSESALTDVPEFMEADQSSEEAAERPESWTTPEENEEEMEPVTKKARTEEDADEAAEVQPAGAFN